MWRYLLNILDYIFAGLFYVFAVMLCVGILGLFIMSVVVLFELLLPMIM